MRDPGEQGVPQFGELGEGLGRRADVLDLDTRNRQADDGTCCRHPVVVVAAPRSAVQRAGLNVQAVLEFGDGTAQAVDLGNEGSETVGLVVTDVANPGDGTRGIGPAAIVNAHRFIFDSRDENAAVRLDILNDQEGVWRCRTTFNCTEACPRGIQVTQAIAEVKQAIMRGKP